MKTINNEKGAILITMLLLMVIVTLLGVIAINTSTIDIQITGYSKREALALQGAEAGIDLSIPIIESTLGAGQFTVSNSSIVTTITITGATTTLDNPKLGTEILAGSDYNTDTPSGSNAITTCGPGVPGSDPCGPDISISNLNGVGVSVDIDRMYSYALPGGSLEFAAGYEGVGAGAAGGGVGVLYSIDSQGTL